jgi:hypothetical protein
MFFTPLAELFDLNFALYFPLVFARPIVDALASFTLKFD